MWITLVDHIRATCVCCITLCICDLPCGAHSMWITLYVDHMSESHQWHDAIFTCVIRSCDVLCGSHGIWITQVDYIRATECIAIVCEV
jgi:hypothetical protein